MDEIETLKLKIRKLEQDLFSERVRISKTLEYIDLFMGLHPDPPLSHQEKTILEMIQSYLND
jgi:hypothetical protein